jgi:hypothetical protein
MSVTITVDGADYLYPSSGEVDTAQKQIEFARAVAAAASAPAVSLVTFSAGTAPADTSLNFLRPFGSNQNAGGMEISFRVPLDCIISRLYVQAANGPAGAGLTITVRKNGVDTLLACVLPVAGTQVADLLNSVTFAAGDRISVSCVGGVGISGTANQVYAAMKVTEV